MGISKMWFLFKRLQMLNPPVGCEICAPKKNTQNRPGGLKFDTAWRVQVAVYLQKPHWKESGSEFSKKVSPTPHFPENSMGSSVRPVDLMQQKHQPIGQQHLPSFHLNRFQRTFMVENCWHFCWGEKNHQQFQDLKWRYWTLEGYFGGGFSLA